jgi:hypothetical protein
VGGVDYATWQALGLTLTVLGLVLSVLLWRRRGAVAGLRAAAWALIPLAAALTGTLRLAWRVGDAVVDWAVRLVLSPTVWLGVVLAGISVVLFVVSGVLRRRGADRAVPAGDTKQPAVTRGPQGQGRPAVAGDDDMADIEAILKKHGIA